MTEEAPPVAPLTFGCRLASATTGAPKPSPRLIPGLPGISKQGLKLGRPNFRAGRGDALAYFLARFACARAASSTFSAVKPNLPSRSLIGAEAPKVCMPTMAPVEPA